MRTLLSMPTRDGRLWGGGAPSQHRTLQDAGGEGFACLAGRPDLLRGRESAWVFPEWEECAAWVYGYQGTCRAAWRT